jgi:DNA polymerase III delta prime subunit
MSYDFSTLNDKEFEKLARDILNLKFNMDLQDFKVGKDQGIDLRYSTSRNNNAVIVQAKHYLRSGYKMLIKDLKCSDLEKVKRLKPDRYILVTSVEVSAGNKDELFQIFFPYIQSANDIFGSEDLNKYLSDLPTLESRWYKLWLSSTNVLQQLLHNAVLGRSVFVESKIVRTIQLYVHCKSYDEAFKILAEHKYILITGQPGVGKTTLAYLLSYSLMSQGHQLIYIDADLKDAEDLFSPDPEAKQIFFFDDFLGATYLELTNPKTTESAFVNFLDRIKNSESKYLILTTRTSIFRNALDKYEKMKRIKVDIARKEIELGQYSVLDKGKILYNHIYHSNLPEKLRSQILTNRNYWDIIQDRNYNPRLIEFISDPRNIPAFEEDDYLKFVKRNFDFPEEVWRYCYLEQLSVEEKLLLNCVYSQKFQTAIDDTKLLFEYMLEYEVKKYNHRPIPSPFYNSLKRLLDGIIKREVHTYVKRDLLTFVNPSLHDFFNMYFRTNEEERWKLIHGSIAIEQFERYKETILNNIDPIENREAESSKFAKFLLSISDKIISYQELKRETVRDRYTHLRLAALLNSLILNSSTRKKSNDFVFKVISAYDIDQINRETWEYYYKCIKYSIYESKLTKYVIVNWNKIIVSLFIVSTKEEEYEGIKSLFDQYNQDYELFLKEDNNKQTVTETITEFMDEQTADWIRDETSEIFTEEDWEDLKEQVTIKRRRFFSHLGLTDEDYDESYFFNSDLLRSITAKNLARRTSEENNIIVNKQEFHTPEDENNVKEIELLFTGSYDPDFVTKMADQLNMPF